MCPHSSPFVHEENSRDRVGERPSEPTYRNARSFVIPDFKYASACYLARLGGSRRGLGSEGRAAEGRPENPGHGADIELYQGFIWDLYTSNQIF